MYGIICRPNGRERSSGKKKSSQKSGKEGKEEIVWTWDKIEELGLGQLGMSYHNLYDLIPRAFWNAVDGYWITQENRDRKEWERMRWQTCCLINVELPRNKQMTLTQLVKFDWEKGGGTEEEDNYDSTKFAYEKMLKRKKLK